METRGRTSVSIDKLAAYPSAHELDKQQEHLFKVYFLLLDYYLLSGKNVLLSKLANKLKKVDEMKNRLNWTRKKEKGRERERERERKVKEHKQKIKSEENWFIKQKLIGNPSQSIWLKSKKKTKS